MSLEDLSLNEMKKISHQIIESEEKKYNISIKVFPLTFIEYYNDYIFKKKFSLTKKIALSLTPIIAGGFNDLKGNTVIFLNYVNKIEKIEDKIFRLVQVCFHEARHSEQSNFDKYSYEGVFNLLDHYIKNNTANIDYNLEHDKYSFEIGANLYGVTMAKEYLKKNYPSLYEKQKEEIEKLEKRYQYDYLMYDASNTVDRFINIAKQAKNITKVTNKVGIKAFQEMEKSTVLDIFLNSDDFSFKKINDIINNEDFKKLDKKVVYAFLSSQSFLNTVNFDELSIEALSMIKESLDYTNQIYQNQEKINNAAKENNLVEKLQFLKSEKSIITNVKKINNYYVRLFKKIMNFTRSEEKRQGHINNVESQLEELEQEISSRKSRGFINLYLFFITIGIILILSIIYIIVS